MVDKILLRPPHPYDLLSSGGRTTKSSVSLESRRVSKRARDTHYEPRELGPHTQSGFRTTFSLST